MENNEKIEIDYKELEKQRRDMILKEGKYCRAEILLGRNDNMPIVNIELKHVKSQDVAKLCVSIKELVNHMKKQYPLEYMLGKQMFKTKNLGNYNEENKEENQNG